MAVQPRKYNFKKTPVKQISVFRLNYKSVKKENRSIEQMQIFEVKMHFIINLSI